MEIHTKIFTRNFLKVSLIGLIFILSCGKVVEVAHEEGESVEWYTKLGFKENMKQMKKDTQLLTRRLGEGDWADAELLGVKIKNSFNTLDIENKEIPEVFFELKQKFDDSLVKLLEVCRDKDHDKVAAQLDLLKKACSYCHRITRKELDRMNLESDYDVAVDKIYKNKTTGGN